MKLSMGLPRISLSFKRVMTPWKFVWKVDEENQNDSENSGRGNQIKRVGFWTLVTATVGQYLLVYLAFINWLFLPSPKQSKEKNREGYPPLYSNAEYFFKFHYFNRGSDIYATPVTGFPGAEIIVKERTTEDHFKFEQTGKETKCVNVSSYCYLGFAGTSDKCSNETIGTLRKYGWATCSTDHEYGRNIVHSQVEALVSEHLQVEDAIVFGTGFATNALNLPTLLNKNCLALSDARNHSSLILGLRLSGATIRVFRHNDMNQLEMLLREGIANGQPDGCQWKKIFIVSEGIYSMDGTLVNLPEIIRLKKKYKAYIYLDEAHSIGAIGPRGAGTVDFYGCNPKDVDVLMGSFSKSLGSSGGFIAGSKELINYLRKKSYAACYGSSMSPPVAQQTISSLEIMLGKDGSNKGKEKIISLTRNTKYFRRRLKQMRVDIRGHEESPIVPLMTYQASKFVLMVRELLRRRVTVAGVGFPVTPLMEGRLRFCLSAAHTKEHLDYVLKQIDVLADVFHLRYTRNDKSNEKKIVY